MKPALILMLALNLSGCAHSFACKGFPQFAACKSATQAYRATEKGAPPGYYQATDSGESESSMTLPRSRASGGDLHAERSPAQTLKIWQAPYEDEHGDLVGSSTVLTEIEPRRWRMSQSHAPVPRRLLPLKVASSQRTPPEPSDEDRGGFPLFQSSQGPRRLHVEEVDYREP